MVNIRKTASIAAVVPLIAALSACVAPAPREIAVRSGPAIDGQWMDQQGVAISTFSNGRFTSVATDTGAKLSEGSYQMRGSNDVSINMTSLIRQTQTSVNCSMVSNQQLNCTNASGQNFVLTRRS